MNRDVVIVGAGPAGASAAVALAQRGVKDVLLLDRATFPREKTCGSGLSPNAIVLAEELGIGADLQRKPPGLAVIPAHRRRILLPLSAAKPQPVGPSQPLHQRSLVFAEHESAHPAQCALGSRACRHRAVGTHQPRHPSRTVGRARPGRGSRRRRRCGA